jgi:serine/threonine-protein kinase
VRLIVAGGVIVAIAVPSLGVLAVRRFPMSQFAAAERRTGNLTIDTRPAGSQVLIDGQGRGVTPLTLALEPGAHTITVRNAGDERVVPLTIAAGAEVSQYYEMKVVEPAIVAGSLSIATDPPGARVAVDGKPRGNSPITVADLAAEPHKVTVTNDIGSVERTVAVTAGSVTSVMFALPKASGPMAGWLSISSPFDVEVLENRDVIGTSGASRIMLASGHHEDVLSHRTLGFQETRRIDVTPGQTTSIRVDAPKASVSVNARPWAEIIVDGANVGQTPIANIQITVGTHEMVFRHPQLGERRETVVVTAKGPNRIAADLTK